MRTHSPSPKSSRITITANSVPLGIQGPFSQKRRKKKGRTFSIVAVAEGAISKGDKVLSEEERRIGIKFLEAISRSYVQGRVGRAPDIAFDEDKKFDESFMDGRM